MAWVCIDKDNTEVITNEKPYKSRFYDEWWYHSEIIILPKGSIKKLIGRDLTWNTEPVEIK